MTKLDRTKIVRAECDVNYKWLTEKIIKNSIVFQWLTNKTQPSFEV